MKRQRKSQVKAVTVTLSQVPYTANDEGQPINLEKYSATEMEPFKDEIELYRTNLLHLMTDLIGKEIMRLSDYRRSIIMQYYYGGKSLRQIAQANGIELRNVQRARFRSLQELRRRLGTNPYFMKLYKAFKESDPPSEVLDVLSGFLEGLDKL
jgi:DNA-directed RNA polymerase specialized sigma24 family protein